MKSFIRVVSILLLILVTILKLDWNSGTLHYSATLKKHVTTDGNIERIDYVDDQGISAFAEDLYYSSVVKTRDDSGRIISEFYFDEKGKPAVQKNGYYGLRKQYDSHGRNDMIIYTDSDGDPMITDLGYAMLKYVFDEEDRVIEQWYLDAEREPIE